MNNTNPKLTERNDIINTIHNIFINTDQQNWDEVKAQFADRVLLDYSSMSGGEPATLRPQEIVDSWRGLLPGFEYTHHALSNLVVTIKDQEAKVFHYGTAAHYLPNDSGHNIWTVIGTYKHHLVNIDGIWKVDRMKFNLKFTHGNNDLPRLAQKRLSQKNNGSPK